ncbi:protein-export chaperone SecB [Pseudomonas fulva]|uniref:Preprotein translocase subunit SecB n=1 Tax=Pseudomonas fulva (strain 12-X) TaxID=743720 RepID=F6AG51_PSEF1|nr:protein-export chaperone SecB [Pseudomonas fulva]AEF21453.1 hypothetical protein Psefu_1477 [Pseudomonas fulva 12-X]
MTNHPIQLLNVLVDELNITVHDRVNFAGADYPKTFDYSVGRTEFDEASKIIAVKVIVSIKPEDPERIDRPFSMTVAVAAQFVVDTEVFPMDKLEQWANHNAPIVILPYVREQAYSLSVRAGFDPIILPLVEVPTIKIQKP